MNTDTKTFIKNLGMITFLIVVGLGGYLYQTIIPGISEKTIELAEVKQELEFERQHLSDLQQLKKEENLVQEYLRLSYNILPNEDRTTSVPFHLLSLAAFNNVTIVSIDVEEPQRSAITADSNGYGRVNTKITLEGTFPRIIAFIKSLQNSNRISTMEKPTFSSRGDDGVVNMSVEMQFYYKIDDIAGSGA